MINIYYGPWKWSTDFNCWKAPDWAIGPVIDLLPNGAARNPGRDRVGCLCATNQNVMDLDYQSLGSFDAMDSRTVTQQHRGKVAQLAGRAVSGDTPGDVIWSLFASGDLTGAQHVAPLRPYWNEQAAKWEKRICICGTTWVKDWTPTDDGETHRQVIIGDVKRAYDEQGPTQAGKVLSYFLLDFGHIFTRAQLTPTGYSIPNVPASTTFNDTFSGSLSSDWSMYSGTWGTDGSGNAGKLTSNDSVQCMYYNTALSSADHYTLCTMGSDLDGFCQAGPAIRCSTSAQSFYQAIWLSGVGTIIYKVVTGTQTWLDYSTTGLAVGDTCKLDGTGSTLTLYINAVQKKQVTDSALSTSYAGLSQTKASSTTYDGTFADVEISDGVSSTVASRMMLLGVG